MPPQAGEHEIGGFAGRGCHEGEPIEHRCAARSLGSLARAGPRQPSNGLDPRTEINARGSRTGKGSSVAKAASTNCRARPALQEPNRGPRHPRTTGGARGGAARWSKSLERMCGRVCARVSVRPNQDQAKGGASPGSEEP